MPELIFVEHDGTERRVQARVGDTVMRTAVAAGVAGIIGECGGCMNCLTCHCYIPAEVAERIPPASEDEAAMLDVVALAQANSRLCCQIVVTEALDGARFEIPEWQG
ncbi:2Fe-2S iron-sulfur cluster-binding protein [Sphingopyxis flava]|uniref:2Fe-2S iron-sulfur cluster-binding protein n=1 Tax=Sphingopyxis flava TaxID=1507287 RepID=UPI0009A81F2A|nr:2Fe-2S iron-sulfur cluster-binding protein [Sphingopyxis flava]